MGVRPTKAELALFAVEAGRETTLAFDLEVEKRDVTSSADDKKRWAILPPPSAEAAALSEDFQIDPRAGLVRDGLSGTRRRPPSKDPSSGPRANSSGSRENTSAPKTSPKSAPERRADELRERYEAFEAARKMSSIQALEPSDSGVPTERPEPVSERTPIVAPAYRRSDQETIPAPEWDDDSIY